MSANRIVLENSRTDGVTPQSYWNVASSTQIEGFATDFSVNAGGTINFKINVAGRAADTLPYKIEIFRLGDYGGAGGRQVASMSNADGTVQPGAIYDATRGLVDAGNWSVTDSWTIPSDAVSGVYLARVQRVDAQGNPIAGATNQIPFVVRNDGVAADVVLQTSDTTWQAYNGWFGNNGQVGANFYGDASGTISNPPVADPGQYAQNRAYAVSYNRPFITRDGTSPASGPQDYLFGADYAAIRFLEKNGYDVSYISGVDTDRLGASYLTNYKAFLSVGHDEYWSGTQRDNVTAARDAGVNLMFWSGNEVYWRTRWENAISADGTAYRTLVCYKETWANGTPTSGPSDYANIDPSNQWTGTWRDLRFVGNPGATGQLPENSLTGQLFFGDGDGQFGAALNVPSDMGALRYWRNTAATDGEANIAPGLIGYEWNIAPDDAFRPAGLIKISDTLINWNAVLTDQGNRTSPGTGTHNLTLYRDPESGALVFGSGTVFWSWGLSNAHDNAPYSAQIESVLLKQFTVNLLADMGIQPGSLEAVLRAATGSTDFVGARATMVDLPDTVAARSATVITGTATDNDGNPATTDGVVALVEISFDGGATWRPTQGTTNWSYTWNPAVQGTYDIRVRAIDDSLNVTNLLFASDRVTVTAPVRPVTLSLFDPLASLPAGTTMVNDNQSVELGMRFNVSEAGTVTQLKYFRAAADAGDTDVRQGHIWRASDGALLGTVTFTSTAGQSGWQVASLSNPVNLVAGVDYIVSYRTANNYVATNNFFLASREAAFDGIADRAFSDAFNVIHAPQDTGAQGTGNGVYLYGTSLLMPNSTYQASNYWTDVTFRPAATGPNTPPTITSGNYTVPENATTVGQVLATDADNDALTYSIAGGADAGRFTINASTGALSFVAPPNFESPLDAGADNIYDLILGVTDGKSPVVVKPAKVTVLDVNEAPANLVLGGSNAVSEAAAPGAVVGTLTGTDPDAGDALTFTLVNSAGGRFAISGSDLVVADGAVLDRETAAAYSVTVRATDRAGLTFEKLIVIGVVDANEFAVTKPVDSNAAQNVVAQGAAAGTAVGVTAFASDADATTNLVTYSLADNAGGRFAINATTGVVTVAAGAVFDPVGTPSHQITVLATSQDGSTATETFVIGVTAAPPVAVTLTSRNDVYVAPDDRSYFVQGLGGSDSITTRAGNDTVDGGAANDTLSTGTGNDVIQVTGASAGFDAVDGGAGTDAIRAAGNGTIIGLSSLANVEQITANGFSGVQVQGTGNADSFNFSTVQLTGITRIDTRGGNDSVVGSAGADSLVGRAGADNLAGGAGADVFVYEALSESRTNGGIDLLSDFTQQQDRIDLSVIDANTLLAGDQAFTVIGRSAFGGLAGQLRFDSTSFAGQTRVYVDVNGDRAADMEIRLTGTFNLADADFVL